MSRWDRFNNDFLGQLHTDTEPDIANLADNIRVLGEKTDFLLFAKAHFAEAMLHLGRGGEFLDSDGSSCADVTKGTNERLLAFPVGLHP